jgi:hypothetical protein
MPWKDVAGSGVNRDLRIGQQFAAEEWARDRRLTPSGFPIAPTPRRPRPPTSPSRDATDARSRHNHSAVNRTSKPLGERSRSAMLSLIEQPGLASTRETSLSAGNQKRATRHPDRTAASARRYSTRRCRSGQRSREFCRRHGTTRHCSALPLEPERPRPSPAALAPRCAARSYRRGVNVSAPLGTPKGGDPVVDRTTWRRRRPSPGWVAGRSHARGSHPGNGP